MWANSLLPPLRAEYWGLITSLTAHEGVQTVCLGGLRLGHLAMHVLTSHPRVHLIATDPGTCCP